MQISDLGYYEISDIICLSSNVLRLAPVGDYAMRGLKGMSMGIYALVGCL